MVGMAAVGMATHLATIETCQQAVVHTADLETISFLCKNHVTAARLLTKTQRLRIPDAGYQLP
jgi:hypothetical protein